MRRSLDSAQSVTIPDAITITNVGVGPADWRIEVAGKGSPNVVAGEKALPKSKLLIYGSGPRENFAQSAEEIGLRWRYITSRAQLQEAADTQPSSLVVMTSGSKDDLELASRLIQQGHRVLVVSPNVEGSWPALGFREGIRVKDSTSIFPWSDLYSVFGAPNGLTHLTRRSSEVLEASVTGNGIALGGTIARPTDGRGTVFASNEGRSIVAGIDLYTLDGNQDSLFAANLLNALVSYAVAQPGSLTGRLQPGNSIRVPVTLSQEFLDASTTYNFDLRVTSPGTIVRDGVVPGVVFSRGAAPGPLRRTFDTETSGWSASSAAGLTATENSHRDGALNFGVYKGDATYGTWESPALELAPSAWADGLRENEGAVGRVSWRVRSDVADPARAPGVRFRSFLPTFQRSDMLVVESAGSGEASPGMTDRLYQHVFHLADFEAQEARVHAMDVFRFSPDDARPATVALDEFRWEALPFPDRRDSDLLAEYTFSADSSSGWQAISPIEAMAPQQFASTSRGLAIRARTTRETPGPPVQFGFWQGPRSDRLYDPGELVIFRFFVRSDAANAQQALQLPTFRLRATSTDNQVSVMTTVTSLGDGETLPRFDKVVTYDLFVHDWQTCGGKHFRPALDLIHAEGAGDEGSLAIYLEKIEMWRVHDPFEQP
ncbi:MAG: hypothetical protein RLY93_13495 [Sumerlaeia bacterium]